MKLKQRKRILVAPLNWGLGHATRCVPIVEALKFHNFEPVIASDGAALAFLKKEFEDLQFVALPSYNISYPKNPNHYKLKFLKDAPSFLKTIKTEEKVISKIVEGQNIDGIISDNRFGVRHHNIPSVFLTHQLRVLSGNTTWLSSKLHQRIITKFDQCWVPDVPGHPNLSGTLGHVQNFRSKIKYIGPLSRLKKIDTTNLYNLIAIISGPEPQRTFLEQKLLMELSRYEGKVLLVKGIMESEQTKVQNGNITIYNYMLTNELELAINQSELVLSRSGYSTIMDLAALEKNAFLIPTPGQFEQEYLAKKFSEEQVFASCNQSDFKVELLETIKDYSSLKPLNHKVNYQELFSLF